MNMEDFFKLPVEVGVDSDGFVLGDTDTIFCGFTSGIKAKAVCEAINSYNEHIETIESLKEELKILKNSQLLLDNKSKPIKLLDDKLPLDVLEEAGSKLRDLLLLMDKLK